MTVAEVVSLLSILYGVALIYVPAALILAGLMGVVAAERKLAPRRSTHRKGAPS
ncbi:hypothetical protein V2W30_22635 [Streptomyces sp. Q6]|uniref:Uncharacterized protein n=1 Tax=Streptomyces citrinus TaxID=3118173 RepID=A0ACD5AF64_9ACTN